MKLQALALGFAAGFAWARSQNKSTIVKGAVPIQPFDLNQYLGLWYEIARLDFFWEPSYLTNCTAQYDLNDDGSIKVTNRGFNSHRAKWNTNTGVAKPVHSPDVAMLTVTFYPPFSGGYNVIDIDDSYTYALIVGDSTKYCWILSRATTIPDEIRNRFLKQLIALNYDVEQLTWTRHDLAPQNAQ